MHDQASFGPAGLFFCDAKMHRRAKIFGHRRVKPSKLGLGKLRNILTIARKLQN